MIFNYNLQFQAKDKVEVDPEAIEKLMVCKADFMNALATDCKPVSMVVIFQGQIDIITLIVYISRSN